MAEKIMSFKGQSKNLDTLSNEIVQRLVADGYNVQSNAAKDGIVIQARKEGVLRDVFAANRAFTIMIAGKPNDFTVRIGIGKFIQNLAVAAAETIVLSDLFLAVAVPEMIWTKVVEKGISKDIVDMVGAEPVNVKGVGISVSPLVK